MDIPTQFDHPYTGHVIEMVMKTEQVDRFCQKSAPVWPLQYYGCSWIKEGVCYMVLSATNTDYIRRHEQAHCNGWPHDH